MTAIAPTTELEQHFWDQGILSVAGVDEVGRGCLAGPVVAAACVLPPDLDDTALAGVRDSKVLTPARRKKLFTEIQEHAADIGIGAASRAEIDQLNIRVASLLAMQRALQQLCGWDHALCDGPQAREWLDSPMTGVIDGDAQCLSIACASIIAKVVRDDMMIRLSARHPEYGWDSNMGYGSRQHLQALREFGRTPHHRISFKPVRLACEGELTAGTVLSSSRHDE